MFKAVLFLALLVVASAAHAVPVDDQFAQVFSKTVAAVKAVREGKIAADVAPQAAAPSIQAVGSVLGYFDYKFYQGTTACSPPTSYYGELLIQWGKCFSKTTTTSSQKTALTSTAASATWTSTDYTDTACSAGPSVSTPSLDTTCFAAGSGSLTFSKMLKNDGTYNAGPSLITSTGSIGVSLFADAASCSSNSVPTGYLFINPDYCSSGLTKMGCSGGRVSVTTFTGASCSGTSTTTTATLAELAGASDLYKACKAPIDFSSVQGDLKVASFICSSAWANAPSVLLVVALSLAVMLKF